MVTIAESPLNADQLFAVTEIGGKDVDIDAVTPTQLFTGLLKPGRISRDQYEVVTTTGQGLGKRMTDAGRGAGDQGGAHHASLARAAVRRVLP